MTERFFVTSKNNPQKFRDNALKGEAKTYSVDLSQWVEENHAINGTPVWSVVSGNASISGAAITNSVASALITFSDSGGVLIKIQSDTAATEKKTSYIEILVRDPTSAMVDDYGLCA